MLTTYVLAVDYAEGPFKGSLVGLFQDGHSSDVSINPTTLTTPVRSYTGITMPGTSRSGTNAFPFFSPVKIGKNVFYPAPRNNYLFDLGFNLTYKVDWLLAYFDFVKNFGSADLYNSSERHIPSTTTKGSIRLKQSITTGCMVDAGVTYFCGPWTANVGGFYTSGPDISSNPGNNGTSETIPHELPVDPSWSHQQRCKLVHLSSRHRQVLLRNHWWWCSG